MNKKNWLIVGVIVLVAFGVWFYSSNEGAKLSAEESVFQDDRIISAAVELFFRLPNEELVDIRNRLTSGEITIEEAHKKVCNIPTEKINEIINSVSLQFTASKRALSKQFKEICKLQLSAYEDMVAAQIRIVNDRDPEDSDPDDWVCPLLSTCCKCVGYYGETRYKCKNFFCSGDCSPVKNQHLCDDWTE